MACFDLSKIWLCYWNEDSLDDQGFDLRHDDLSMWGRIVNVAFCLAVDPLNLCLDCQIPSGTWHSSLNNGLLIECQTHDLDVVSSNPGRSGRKIFFSRVNFVYWPLLCVHFTPVLLQWHVKNPDHSAKSAGGMHTPLTQQIWNGLTML